MGAVLRRLLEIPALEELGARLFCAVGAIAGISQSRDNEPSSLIESIVDGRSPKTNVGMNPTYPLHSLLNGNQTDETDVLCSAFLDTINGASGCITSCQHRRHDDDEPLRKVGTSCEKIRMPGTKSSGYWKSMERPWTISTKSSPT